MKAKIDVTLKPFTVPNFVLVEDPRPPDGTVEREAGSFPLEMVDPETLDRLCDDFKTAVFAKAKKSPPPTVTQERAVCRRGGEARPL